MVFVLRCNGTQNYWFTMSNLLHCLSLSFFFLSLSSNTSFAIFTRHVLFSLFSLSLSPVTAWPRYPVTKEPRLLSPHSDHVDSCYIFTTTALPLVSPLLPSPPFPIPLLPSPFLPLPPYPLLYYRLLPLSPRSSPHGTVMRTDHRGLSLMHQ